MISQQQKKILAFPYTKYKILICNGAIRSGKTTIMTWAFVDWAMKNFDNCWFGICGKTIGSAIKNIIQPFKSMTLAKETYQIKWRGNPDNLLIISKGGKTNTFEVFGGKDERSQDLIQGRTLAGILLDEVVLMPESFVNQAIARCSVEGNRKWFSCNPGNPSHWFYRNWVQKAKEKNALVLQFALTDNPSLSEEQIRDYHSYYEGVFYERYILGRWVAAEGIIYRQFADHTDLFKIDKAPMLPIVVIGLDYGAGQSKTTMKAIGFDYGFKSVYILAEKDIDGVHDPDSLYKHFHDFYNAVIKDFGKVSYVFGDWGGLGNTLNKGLYVYCRKNGLPVRVEDCTKGTILERIELTQKLMAERRLFVLKTCPNMIKAFQEALWSDKQPDTRLDDGTTDIDSLDAFEYALFPFEEKLLKAVKYT